MEKFKNITALEDLAEYINSVEGWDSDIEKLCKEKGWKYHDSSEGRHLIATDEEGRTLVFKTGDADDTCIVYPDGYGDKTKHKYTIACTVEGTQYYNVYAKDEDEAREKATILFEKEFKNILGSFDVEDFHSTAIN